MSHLPAADERSVLEEFERLLGGAQGTRDAKTEEEHGTDQPDSSGVSPLACSEEDWERSLDAVLAQLQSTGIAQQRTACGHDSEAGETAGTPDLVEARPQDVDDRVDVELDAALSQFAAEMGASQEAGSPGAAAVPSAELAAERNNAETSATEVESLITNLVQTILSKDVLYAPMLEIRGLYEYQLNRGEMRSGINGEPPLTEADRERYRAQYACVNEIIACLEDDSQAPSSQTEKLMDLISRMESMGDPPPGVLETMNHAKEGEHNGLNVNRGPGNAEDPEQMMALLEALMRDTGDASNDAPDPAELQRLLREASPSANECRMQ